MGRYSNDRGFEVFGQNIGCVVRHDVIEEGERRSRFSKPIRNPNAKRIAWEQARELAVRLDAEHRRGFTATWIRITRFDGERSAVVFNAFPGDANWSKLLAPARVAA